MALGERGLQNALRAGSPLIEIKGLKQISRDGMEISLSLSLLFVLWRVPSQIPHTPLEPWSWMLSMTHGRRRERGSGAAVD